MKPHAPILDTLLADLLALAKTIRTAGDDQQAWDDASEEFDRIMTTAVKVALVEEVAELREWKDDRINDAMERDLRD